MTPRRAPNVKPSGLWLKRKTLMLESGKTARWCAEQLRPPVNEASVSQVMSGRSRSRRIEAFLAKTWGVPVEDVFPEGPVE